MALSENQQGTEAGLKQAFADFAAVQAEQRIAFEAGNPGDLAVCRERRERVFGSLKFYLNRLILEQPGQDGQLYSEVKARINELLADEKLLESAAAVQRQIVWEKLSSMRKGKRALAGYDLGQGNVKSARFLSSRT